MRSQEQLRYLKDFSGLEKSFPDRGFSSIKVTDAKLWEEYLKSKSTFMPLERACVTKKRFLYTPSIKQLKLFMQSEWITLCYEFIVSETRYCPVKYLRYWRQTPICGSSLWKLCLPSESSECCALRDRLLYFLWGGSSVNESRVTEEKII